MIPRRVLEDQLVLYSQRLHQAGFVANHDGNLSARLADGRFLATPTAISKANVTRERLIVVDSEGRVVSGTGKPFTELALHLATYRVRADVMAVIHAHPPVATGFAVAGVAVRTAMIAEAVVSLGAVVPLVMYARPKTPEWTAALAPHLEDADLLLLEHHGALTCGPDLETCYLRMELVEHLAKIQLAATQVAAARDIPAADVQKLLEARTAAGLGKAGRQLSTKR
ncbi:MAG: class II aldolase/adducin family protein [Deltaproteobacteria bacterium]|nr:class II aldolase/adducin family protein [Deltaproteobacteria bacterium]